MKRRLIVLRHAKSDWDTDAASDHARPLNKRGRRDAPRVGEHLASLGWVPERVVSSDSTRTRETWDLMRDAFDPPPDVTFTRRLYHAGIAPVRDVLAEVPGAVGTVMVIGHNPGWESVVQILSGLDVPMSTANAALLEVDAPSWVEGAALDAAWRLVDVVRPKEIS
jgi:phosphohistidine phosphatase